MNPAVSSRVRALALVVLLCAARLAAAELLDESPLRFAAIGEVSIAYQDLGPADGVPVLLVMGLGAPLTYWGEPLLDALHLHGLRVIVFDNRDVGLSSCRRGDGRPWLWWHVLQYKLGLASRAAYTLEDMAGDAIGLLDHLHIARAHVVGASLGGMIAQRIALDHPERVRSLVSIMSTTGERDLPLDPPKLPRPPRGNAPRETIIAVQLEVLRRLANNDAVFDEGYARAMLERSYDRERCGTGGIRRQLVAVLAAQPTAKRLPALTVPTLVIHGELDPLLPLAHGERTAALIPGAQLVRVPGMGHSLPPAVVPAIADALTGFIDRVEVAFVAPPS